MKLPSRSELPEYYQQIKEPRDLNMIRRKLEKGLYKAMRQFYDDVHLMVENAMAFNTEGSQVCLSC